VYVSCAVRATSHETIEARRQERERHQSPLWSLRPAARAESCVRKRTPMHTCTQNILHVALYRIDEQENTCDDTHPTPSSRHRVGVARRDGRPRCSSSCSRRSSGFVPPPARAPSTAESSSEAQRAGAHDIALRCSLSAAHNFPSSAETARHERTRDGPTPHQRMPTLRDRTH
jgi:hypothetical protein